MAKVMLVEDDNNLREIYGARLQAEGYDIVSAQDGEEALALAVKEKPDLIISDVMMPRISGFDMLDILRNAPETKDTKVIMMTALSQAEDKSRADKLGADRYLVKSQVTLEDVANVVREVLGEDENVSSAPATEASATPVDSNDNSTPLAASDPETTVASQPQPDEVPPPVPGSEPAPSPDPVAPVPPPATNTAPVNPQPAPEIPEIIASPAVEAAPEPPQTVDAIANPDIEVHDEPNPSEVQPPPPTSDTASDSDTTANLPPIVEAKEPAATPIKVELPKPLDETPSAKEQPVQATAPQNLPQDQSQPATPPVGPSLSEAMASEQQESTGNRTTINVTTPSDDDIPAVSNGAPVPTVITPTEPPAGQQATDSPVQTAPTSGTDVNGKRVIQPLNDPTAQPDLEALLAAEEAKAAVSNPAANTVIEPKPSTGAGQPTPTASSNKDDLNNIAL